MAYGPTFYEIAAEGPDGLRVLVAYVNSRSRRSLIDCVRDRAALAIALTGAEIFETGRRAADGITLGLWRIRYSGRTKREARASGCLPYIRDVVEAGERAPVH